MTTFAAPGAMTTTEHPILDAFDADAVRAVMVHFRDLVKANQAGINRLNVYPVPDGDTGTNMARTLDAVVAAIDPVESGQMDPLCAAVAHGSLMGARGNSGVILSQILRGLADGFRSAGRVGARAFADALTAASTAAYGAVGRPIEGTILTVIREAAAGAQKAADATPSSLVGALEAAHDAGRVALDDTPRLLPVLADAGVVDAGGAGFLLLLDAALHVADGRELPPADAVAADLEVGLVSHDVLPDVADLRYEVMFFLDLPDTRLGEFKTAWGDIGDSIVVVGGDGLFNCHVHTNDIGAAIEVALDHGGRPRSIRVTDLFEEMDAEHAHHDTSVPHAHHDDSHPHDGAGNPSTAPATTAVVAVAAGLGLVELLRSLGVGEVVGGGQTMNPSTAELLAAVERAASDTVVLLPNNKNIVPVALRVDELSAKRVLVVPTISMPEALAALFAYDPEDDGDSVVRAMTTAVGGVRSGEVTRAVRESVSDAGPIAAGDWIGLVRGDGIVAVAADLPGALCELLDHLTGDEPGLVTLIEGQGASDAITEHARAWLTANRPGVELEVHPGGQPLYPYLVGVE